MKKLLNPMNLPLVVLGAGVAGAFLRLWMQLGGMDEKGMLISGHPARILCVILSVAVLAVLFLATRPLKRNNGYRYNFPSAPAGGIGIGLGGLGMAITGLVSIVNGSSGLDLICDIATLFSAVLLGYCAWCRMKGLRPNPLAFTVVSISLMLRLISFYRHWSGDPFLLDYCYQLLACVFLMLAVFQRAMFCARMGKRHSYVFFALGTVFFCCLSLTTLENVVFYLPAGVWMFFDLCRLDVRAREERE